MRIALSNHLSLVVAGADRDVGWVSSKGTEPAAREATRMDTGLGGDGRGFHMVMRVDDGGRGGARSSAKRPRGVEVGSKWGRSGVEVREVLMELRRS